MVNRVDVKKFLEAVKAKLEAMESRLDNIANKFKTIKGCLKEWKEIVIKEEDNKIEA